MNIEEIKTWWGYPDREGNFSGTIAEKIQWLIAEVERLATANTVLKSVDTAIRDYHYTLDIRQHGGVAQDAAITAIEKALRLPWEPQKERKRREKAESVRS